MDSRVLHIDVDGDDGGGVERAGEGRGVAYTASLWNENLISLRGTSGFCAGTSASGVGDDGGDLAGEGGHSPRGTVSGTSSGDHQCLPAAATPACRPGPSAQLALSAGTSLMSERTSGRY